MSVSRSAFIKSFKLEDAYKKSKELYENMVGHETNKSKAAKDIKDILSSYSKQLPLYLKDLLEKCFSSITGETIKIDDDVELIPGIFIKLTEDYNGLAKNDIVFLSEEDKLVALVYDDNIIKYNAVENDMKYSHPSFEEVEEWFKSMGDKSKVELINSIIEEH